MTRRHPSRWLRCPNNQPQTAPQEGGFNLSSYHDCVQALYLFDDARNVDGEIHEESVAAKLDGVYISIQIVQCSQLSFIKKLRGKTTCRIKTFLSWCCQTFRLGHDTLASIDKPPHDSIDSNLRWNGGILNIPDKDKQSKLCFVPTVASVVFSIRRRGRKWTVR